MNQLKSFLNRVFIEGLGAMALGLFSTLIIGTIMVQLGSFIGGSIGEIFVLLGKIASAMTGAGIGASVAFKLKQSPLVMISSATAGMVGAFAGKIANHGVIVEDGILLSGPGEPLGAFIAAYVAIEIGGLVAGKTKVDILVTPLATIVSGSVIGLLVGPPITRFMQALGTIINWGTEQQPFLMGIIVSVVMGIVLTLPISSAALGIILNLSGMAAGAATIGCCCHMVGFAVMSYRENKLQGLIAQGIGTSMLQVPNLMKKPVLWLPVVISSAILGPIGILVFGMTNNATGSGMGTAGLVGQIMTYQTMTQVEPPLLVLVKILVIQVILPAVLTLGISEFMRRKQVILEGDLKLQL
ncbi:MAG TPA: PTS sugar transporter subunit IIC [Candidatus Merdenecus merdavium]|nr:PTS sugar transporter subunit IIC [Candidatus Merdenecus merdavium]